MKAIISMIMCLFLFVGVQSQTKNGTITTGNSYIDLNFNAADTVAAGQTAYDIIVFSAQHFPTTQDLAIQLDSIDAPGATVALFGSKFGTTYAAIDSATWAGSTADTTIVISNTTANRYRYYKVTVTRTAGKAAISDFKFKQYFE